MFLSEASKTEQLLETEATRPVALNILSKTGEGFLFAGNLNRWRVKAVLFFELSFTRLSTYPTS